MTNKTKSTASASKAICSMKCALPVVIVTSVNLCLLLAHLIYRIHQQVEQQQLPTEDTINSFWTNMWGWFVFHAMIACAIQLTQVLCTTGANSHSPTHAGVIQIPFNNYAHETAVAVDDVLRYKQSIEQCEYLQAVPDYTDEYTQVEAMVLRTWKYNQRLGKDSVGLEHDHISVTAIYWCCPPAKVTKRHESTRDSDAFPVNVQPLLTHTCIDTDVSNGSTASMNQHSDDDTFVDIDLGKAHIDQSKQNIQSYSQSSNTSQSAVITMPDYEQDTRWRLLHGTCIRNVTRIAKHSFDLSRSRPGRALFGKGIYLAESSEKADQYADDVHSRRSTDLTMFVVAVHPGDVINYSKDDTQEPRYPWLPRRDRRDRNKAYSTLVASGSTMRFREFIVRDDRRCLPEYLIVYDRIKRRNIVKQ